MVTPSRFFVFLFLVVVSAQSAITPFVQGSTKILNGQQCSYLGNVFTAQNSPSAFDAPPSLPESGWFYVFNYTVGNPVSSDTVYILQSDSITPEMFSQSWDWFRISFGLVSVAGVVSMVILGSVSSVKKLG